MTTKLSQDQVNGLSDELNSLESMDGSLNNRITTEDNINDSIDISLQEQLNVIKNVLLTLIFGNRLDVIDISPDLIAMAPTEFSILVLSTTWVWYLNDQPILDSNSNNYRPLESGDYKLSVTYQTSLGSHYIESYPIFYTVS